MGLVVGVAVAEMLSAWLPPAETRLKWPNDVQVGGAKISGILLESQITDGALDWMVAGIGVNLRSSPAGTPYPTTSVMACSGRLVRRSDAARRLLTALGRWVRVWETQGFAPVRAAWCACGHRPGEPITVRMGDEVLHGRFLRIEEDGALALETTEGVQRIVGGEIAR
jgi:BirA family biotin operon repressor/biotin-[acetyl-CoA-carboxylase] ligase